MGRCKGIQGTCTCPVQHRQSHAPPSRVFSGSERLNTFSNRSLVGCGCPGPMSSKTGMSPQPLCAGPKRGATSNLFSGQAMQGSPAAFLLHLPLTTPSCCSPPQNRPARRPEKAEQQTRDTCYVVALADLQLAPNAGPPLVLLGVSSWPQKKTAQAKHRSLYLAAVPRHWGPLGAPLQAFSLPHPHCPPSSVCRLLPALPTVIWKPI